MSIFSKDNDSIDCSVHDCKFCDCKCDKCSLKKIKVCNCHGDGNKEKTMCDSYKKRISKIFFFNYY